MYSTHSTCACKSVLLCLHVSVCANKCLHVQCTNAHTFPGHLAQLMRPSIGQNLLCIASDFTQHLSIFKGAT